MRASSGPKLRLQMTLPDLDGAGALRRSDGVVKPSWREGVQACMMAVSVGSLRRSRSNRDLGPESRQYQRGKQQSATAR